MTTHSEEKAYSCTECNKTFSVSQNLRNHEKVHEHRERSYMCEYCEKDFKKVSNLKTHLGIGGSQYCSLLFLVLSSKFKSTVCFFLIIPVIYEIFLTSFFSICS